MRSFFSGTLSDGKSFLNASSKVSGKVPGVAEGRWQKICELRAKGYIVVEDSGEGCTQQIVERNGQWQLEDI